MTLTPKKNLEGSTTFHPPKSCRNPQTPLVRSGQEPHLGRVSPLTVRSGRSLEVCGPDSLGRGKFWRLAGQSGQAWRIQLQATTERSSCWSGGSGGSGGSSCGGRVSCVRQVWMERTSYITVRMGLAHLPTLNPEPSQPQTYTHPLKKNINKIINITHNKNITINNHNNQP